VRLKRIVKGLGISLIAIIIIGFPGMVIWAKTGERHAQDKALSALESSKSLTVTMDDWIVFEPSVEPEIGFIFYPGGLVEAKAYAPILRQISEEGIFIIITPMPLNLAIFDTNAANQVIDAFPRIETWIIAGHSLGGSAAAIYTENYPELIDAIIFWDSYPADSSDLSDNQVSALSIYGTMDNQPNNAVLEKTHLLPADTIYIGIEGANHAQFGDYGPQAGDVEALITPDDQHNQVAEIMLDFINP